jgi:hypothetical protein
MPSRFRRSLVAGLASCSGLLGLRCEQSFYFDPPAAVGPDAAASTPSMAAPRPPDDCSSDHDCALAALHCDVPSARCVECVVDEDCALQALARCDTERHRCIECSVDRDCSASYRCDGIGHRCMELCREEPDCSAGAHGCDERRGVCVACDDDHECDGAAQRVCALDGSGCVECRSDSHCAAGLHCDPIQSLCVECRDGGDCLDGLCDPSTHACSAP